MLLAMTLASCRNQDPASSSQAGQLAVAPAVAPAVANGVASEVDPAPPVASEWLLALDGEGLRIFNANTGASRLLAFGENEKQAMETIPAIPLYFSASYSLVKPYIQGFDSNALDAPSLKDVKIDNNWQATNLKTIPIGQ